MNAFNYLDPKYSMFRIRVKRYSSELYRASTNEDEFYMEHIRNLPYRDNFDDAQKDLDRIAVELNLKVDDRE